MSVGVFLCKLCFISAQLFQTLGEPANNWVTSSTEVCQKDIMETVKVWIWLPSEGLGSLGEVHVVIGSTKEGTATQWVWFHTCFCDWCCRVFTTATSCLWRRTSRCRWRPTRRRASSTRCAARSRRCPETCSTSSSSRCCSSIFPAPSRYRAGLQCCHTIHIDIYFTQLLAEPQMSFRKCECALFFGLYLTTHFPDFPPEIFVKQPELCWNKSFWTQHNVYRNTACITHGDTIPDPSSTFGRTLRPHQAPTSLNSSPPHKHLPSREAEGC